MVDHKRVHHLYCLEGLQVRMRVRCRKRLNLHRGPAPIPQTGTIARLPSTLNRQRPNCTKSACPLRGINENFLK
jgi:hypothetical protein